jgi:hypothetical protein
MLSRFAFVACTTALVTTAARAADSGHWVDLAPLNLARQEIGAARIGDRVFVV